jgi:DNA-binding XRE family transcriptional regulator
VRFPVNGDLFVTACAAKGARTDEDRATLIGTTPKMTWSYRKGHVEPRLATARRIAAALEVSLDELWPAA